jgi:predicted transcriptional regulator
LERLMDDPKTLLEEIDDEAEERALDEAEADVAAGRVVPQEDVIEWLKSWGTTHELPCPVKQPK